MKKENETHQQDIAINICAGRTVRSLRKKKGLSGDSLSLMVGISQQQISRYERGLGCISMVFLFKIMACLNITFDCFFDEFFFIYKNEMNMDKKLFLERYYISYDDKEKQA